ncbi:MAG: matrixin family metalloprotease, partial [Planctomycetota bacterium]
MKPSRRVRFALLVLTFSLAAALDAPHSHAGFGCPLHAVSYCACGGHSPAAIGDSDPGEVSAFQTGMRNGITRTSTTSSSLPGRPVEATWSVVPDGTPIPASPLIPGESNDPSSLIGFLDNIFHNGPGPGGSSELMQRDWWPLVNSAFERWDQLSGVSFSYEPADDGAAFPNSLGVLGTRGDIRLSGHRLDGGNRPSILAYNYSPNRADMVIDTTETVFFSDDSGNYLRLRNMLMHEIGHGLGIMHVESADVNPGAAGVQFGTFLMEPTLSTAFDGPQFDDILAVHTLYGDALDKGAGNDTAATATPLGTATFANPLAIGTDADDAFVAFDETDFVSIDDETDDDYFSFTIQNAGKVNLVLTPKGPSYLEGPEQSAGTSNQDIFDASALNDLSMSLFD